MSPPKKMAFRPGRFARFSGGTAKKVHGPSSGKSWMKERKKRSLDRKGRLIKYHDVVSEVVRTLWFS